MQRGALGEFTPMAVIEGPEAIAYEVGELGRGRGSYPAPVHLELCVDQVEGGPSGERQAREHARVLRALGIECQEDQPFPSTRQVVRGQHILPHRQTRVTPGRPQVHEHQLVVDLGLCERGIRGVFEPGQTVMHRRRLGLLYLGRRRLCCG